MVTDTAAFQMTIYNKMAKSLYIGMTGIYMVVRLACKLLRNSSMDSSDFVWELVPVDDSPGEEGVPVYLTGGSLLVELVSS